MRGDGQIHNDGCVTHNANGMGFVCNGEAELSGFNRLDITLDFKFGGSLQDEEDFVAQVVAVSGVEALARFNFQESGPHFRCDKQIPDVIGVSIVVNSERHWRTP
jgi:hypothetical protein